MHHLIETRTSPPLPTVPETGPPEILPSLTFTVEVVCASQTSAFGDHGHLPKAVIGLLGGNGGRPQR